MNREEVIRMAREADDCAEKYLQCKGEYHPDFHDVRDERFAALVAAAERRKHQADIEAWKAEAATAKKWRGMAHARHCDSAKVVQEIQREAMERERDACAQVCDRLAAEVDKYPSDCAFAIRSRGNP